MDPELIRRQSEAEATGWWYRGRGEIVRSLLPLPDRPRRVADIGCGWGGLTETLAPWGDVVGIEPSEAARAEAERRGVEVLEGDADALPLEDASIDLAVSTDVLEHLDDDVAAVREIARVLVPGGAALVTVPAYPRLFSGHDRALDHRRRYTRETLLEAIRGGGLEPLRVTNFNSILLPAAAAARLGSRNGEPSADSGVAPKPLNGLLLATLRFERALLRRTNLPAGLSIAVLATRA